MDTAVAMARNLEAAKRGDRSRVFDWDKAAKMIRDNKPEIAGAGLEDDWEWTGGDIYRDGQVVMDEYTHLSSNHATPQISIDGNVFPCWTYMDERGWNEDTKWPESALAILFADLLVADA